MTPSCQATECNNVNSSSERLDLDYKQDNKKTNKQKKIIISWQMSKSETTAGSVSAAVIRPRTS